MFTEYKKTLTGINNKPILVDVSFSNSAHEQPLIIYIHGYNGFKDWGNFSIIVQQLVKAGFAVAKFNFSHNGTTPDAPEEFVDLEAFSNNNYTIQLDEIRMVMDWCLHNEQVDQFSINRNKVALIGHSLGGGLAILKAAEDKRITKLVTWAAISECKTPWGSWPQTKIDEWERTGVAYTVNGRTSQQMPLKFQLYQDFRLHGERLDIEAAIKSLSIPILIVHGIFDGSVLVQKAYDLKSFQPYAILFLVDSDHVFGRKHPWPHAELPIENQKVVDKTIEFLLQDGWK